MVTQVPSQNIFDMYFHAAKFIRQWFVAGVTENPDVSYIFRLNIQEFAKGSIAVTKEAG